mgnify:CR=1 FL=1
MIGRFGICVVAASLAGLSVSAEVSGYVTPEQDVMSPFFERALDAYYCAKVNGGSEGLFLLKTLPRCEQFFVANSRLD